jgi:hypothetical protein
MLFMVMVKTRVDGVGILEIRALPVGKRSVLMESIDPGNMVGQILAGFVKCWSDSVELSIPQVQVRATSSVSNLSKGYKTGQQNDGDKNDLFSLGYVEERLGLGARFVDPPARLDSHTYLEVGRLEPRWVRLPTSLTRPQ